VPPNVAQLATKRFSPEDLRRLASCRTPGRQQCPWFRLGRAVWANVLRCASRCGRNRQKDGNQKFCGVSFQSIRLSRIGNSRHWEVKRFRPMGPVVIAHRKAKPMRLANSQALSSGPNPTVSLYNSQEAETRERGGAGVFTRLRRTNPTPKTNKRILNKDFHRNL